MDSAECWYSTEKELFDEMKQHHPQADSILSETGIILPFTPENVVFLCQSIESFSIGQKERRPKPGAITLAVLSATVEMLPPTGQTTIYMTDPSYVSADEVVEI